MSWYHSSMISWSKDCPLGIQTSMENLKPFLKTEESDASFGNTYKMSTGLYNKLNMQEEPSWVLNPSFVSNPPLSLVIGVPTKAKFLTNRVSKR